ncbi:hypothetical protein TSTA_088120 [Talaromyces stipitatus ATCC 10500]|uniref:Uncharacterized protein n=1 Tax=Talaromyces stipitatus (strain ATCC 10500 / CBS 375.48 / QM 6759 / NRRL 1006) TaxID=441959 RepID=B8M2B2_TALSN|nr:uncharacterized protein TSTA_088120 [Talaromyces stipitatus ATCC 10500]EED21576.1 hypothetical protein TSTA_088120 [Talaromyces stipitatus ATCC 10500]
MAYLQYLLLLLTSRVPSVWAQVLFHGTSVIISPFNGSDHPRDSSFHTANFYCYATPTGYFSFGWWLPAKPGTDTSRCSPDAGLDSIDWFEYTTSGGCGATTCKVHAVNYMLNNTRSPLIDVDYFAVSLDIANGEPHGQLALSYFDQPGGAYAVGSREILSGGISDHRQAKECELAFKTLSKIYAEYEAPLTFDLKDPCKKGLLHGLTASFSDHMKQSFLGWRKTR